MGENNSTGQITSFVNIKWDDRIVTFKTVTEAQDRENILKFCEWMNVEKWWVGMVIEIEMNTVTKRICKNFDV